MAFALAKKTTALALGTVIALTGHGHAHADLSSGQHRNGYGHGDPASPSTEGAGIGDRIQIQLQIASSSHQHEMKEKDWGDHRSSVMTVMSHFNPGDFFSKDYVYIFHPPPLIDVSSSIGEPRHQWQVQRLPRPSRTLHAATQRDADNVTEPSARQDVGGEYVATFTNSLAMVIVTNALAASACIMLIALAAGLNQGMFSLDPVSLEIKRRASPNPEEQRWSAELLPLLAGHSKRHRLLCSLLLLNSIANEALPLFLDGLFPSRTTTGASIVASTTLVLLFGEILPQAFFMSPRQVEIAARLVPLSKAIMFVFTPIALPISKLLDWILGNAVKHGRSGSDLEHDVTEGHRYTRTELSALVRIQYESQLLEKRKRKKERAMALKKSTAVRKSNNSSNSFGGGSERNISSSIYSHHFIRTVSKELVESRPPKEEQKRILASIQQDEIAMIEGALKMNTKVAADVATPLRKVFALPSDTILDENTMVEIWRSGFSRIPVYFPKTTTDRLIRATSPPLDFVDTSRIVGVLMVRQLIVINHADNRSLDTLPISSPPCISPTMTLVDLITLFQADGGRGGRALHLALVCARPQLATEALEQGEHIPREAGVAGIITLEDVVEELLQGEMHDETDRDLELSRLGVDKWTRDVNKEKMSQLNPQLESAGATERSPLIK